MWITVDVERVLRVDRGINVILCNPMLGSGGPQTLVLKLKGSEMTDEVQRLRSALENIADWRNVNISGEYEHGLRDIIRSIIDCAVDALDAPQVPRPAPQAAPTRDEIASAAERIIIQRHFDKKIDGYTLPTSLEIADAILALSRPASSTCHGCGASFDPNCTVCGGLKYAKGGY